jgi:hypothetical protein
MDPDTDIETRLYGNRRRTGASRAPWDPPPRPAKRSTIRRRASDGRREGADAFGGSDDDMGRGAD